jgi:hypothetical protein
MKVLVDEARAHDRVGERLIDGRVSAVSQFRE